VNTDTVPFEVQPSAQLYHCDYRIMLDRILAEHGPVDCMVMDPPYRFVARGGGKFMKARPKYQTIHQDGLDQGFDLDLLSWKNAHSIVVFCHNDQLGDIIARLKQGFHRHRVCVVRKKTPSPMCNKHYRPDTEFYVHAWQRGWHPIGTPQELLSVTDVGNPEKHVDHPTVKPLELMRKIMRNVNGNLVFDPFMGTGTTGVAALEAGKDFIGCEIVSEYFRCAQRRIRDRVAGE